MLVIVLIGFQRLLLGLWGLTKSGNPYQTCCKGAGLQRFGVFGPATFVELHLTFHCSHVEIHCFFAMCVVSSESMLFGTRFNIKFLLDGVRFWHEFEESMRRLDPPSLLCRRLRNGFRSWFNLRWSWSRQPKSRAKVWSFWCCFLDQIWTDTGSGRQLKCKLIK